MSSKHFVFKLLLSHSATFTKGFTQKRYHTISFLLIDLPNMIITPVHSTKMVIILIHFTKWFTQYSYPSNPLYSLIYSIKLSLKIHFTKFTQHGCYTYSLYLMLMFHDLNYMMYWTFFLKYNIINVCSTCFSVLKFFS